MSLEGATNEKIVALQKEVDETAELMMVNIEKTLDRGEKLDELQERAEDLEEESKQFQATTKKVKKKYWWKNKKWTLIIIGVSVGVVLIIILAIVLSIKPWK